MQQRPMGPKGTFTDEQKKRSILYAFSMASTAVDKNEENKKLYETLRDDIEGTPRKDNRQES